MTLPNAPATIDSDYRGEIMVALVNLGTEPFRVTRGMRIAQMIFARVERGGFDEVAELPEHGAGRGRVRQYRSVADLAAHRATACTARLYRR